MSTFPDYYEILGIYPTASQEDVRQAYKRESLKTHPDRLVNATPAEKQKATANFQAVADAYYVLSDANRRRQYDALYAARASERTADPNASSGFFSQFSSFFPGGDTSTGAAADEGTGAARPNPDNVFTDVFDELLRPEVERRVPWWSYLGAACGGGLGFIVANIPGLMLGAVAGNRLGAIRDAKGKSVAAVFNELGAAEKAEILRALALKLLGSAR